MSLLLNVTSYRDAHPAYPMGHTLKNGSASIGRFDTCDWQLPDPDKFLSGLHVVIEHSNNEYRLTDHSSNGVYINDDQNPVGNGNTVVINHGDDIYLGEYLIQATITKDEDINNTRISDIPDENYSDLHDPFSDLIHNPVKEIIDDDDSGDLTAWDNELINNKPTVEIKIDRQAIQTPHAHAHAHPQAEQNHDPALNEAFNDYSRSGQSNTTGEKITSTDTNAALPTPSIPSSSLPEDWLNPDEPGTAINTSSDPLIPEQVTITNNKLIDPLDLGTTNQSLQKKIDHDEQQRPAIPNNEPSDPLAIDKAKQEVNSPFADTMNLEQITIADPETAATTRPTEKRLIEKDDAAAISRFLKSAGLKATPEIVDMGADLFDQLGLIFRTSIDGMREVIIARSKLKNELRLDATTIRSSGNNPIKFSMTTEDALIRLLSPETKGYMSPVTAIEEVVDDLKAHQVAMLAGMQSAFQSVLARFEPGLLEHQL